MTSFDITDDRFKSITRGADGTPVAATVVLKGERTPAFLAALAAVEDGEPEPPGPPPVMYTLDAPWGEALGMDPRAEELRRLVYTRDTRDWPLADIITELHRTFAPYFGTRRKVEHTFAQAVQESWWDQDQLGDDVDPAAPDDITPERLAILDAMQPPLARNAQGQPYCSYSFLQVKIVPWYHPSTYPYARENPWFAGSYALAYQAVVAKGWMTWIIDEGNTAYAAYRTKIESGGMPTDTEMWAALSAWYSGLWRDSFANAYANQVKAIYNAKTWQPFIDGRLDAWHNPLGAARAMAAAAKPEAFTRLTRPAWRGPALG